MNPFSRAIRWACSEAWEKINILATWRELKALGKKHGMRFFIFALIWELIEDVLFPYLSWRAGMPALIPFFLVMHFEPLVYPVAFWVFRTYDRVRGREPWEPERVAMSSHWRSGAKVLMHTIAASGWYVSIVLSLGFSPKVIAAYSVLIAAFSFVHERIWHDTNFGIGVFENDPDHVFAKRILAKTATYTIVSTTVLASLFKVSFGGSYWLALLACQGLGSVLYASSEAVWSRSKWGVAPTGRPSPIPEAA